MKVITGQEGYTTPSTVCRQADATVITNFTIPPMAREALGGGWHIETYLLTTRGYEDATVVEDVLEGLAAQQLEYVGTVTRAVTRATTRALKEAQSTPRLMLPTETEAGTGGA